MKTVKKVLLALFLGLAVPACDLSHPELDIVLERDFSEVIEAINDANKSLTDKLTLIQAAVNGEMAGGQSLLSLVKSALASLSGTLEEKLAAIQAAVNARSTSLETKLALVEAAAQSGFANAQAQQALMLQVLKSLEGSAEEKLSAIEAAVKAQTSAFETKLGLIEAALKSGFATSEQAQTLIKEAIDSLGNTLEEKLAAIEQAVKSEATTLDTKLDLISAALEKGVGDQGTALENFQKALEASLKGLDTAQAEVMADIIGQLKALSGKLTTEELAKAFKGMADAIGSQMQSEQELLNKLLTEVDNLTDALGPQYELILEEDVTKTVTLTTGNDFRVKLSVNPSDAVLVKDSLKIQIVSHKLFYPEGVDKATDSDHFVVRSLEADPATAGQYVATISTSAAVTVWDESVLWFVYNFGNKKRAKYASTHPLAVTMMPHAKDALERRYYPNGSFHMRFPKKDLEMGKIYYALGSKRFSTEDGVETRTYSADNLTRAKFIQPDKPDTASVFTKLDSRHFVSFSPDTVGNLTWRKFLRRFAEDHLFQEVSGQLALTDRWGTTDSIDLAMKWYVTWPIPYEIVDTVNVWKPSDFEKTSAGYVYKYPEIWPKRLNLWGLDFDTIQSSGAELENTHQGAGDGYRSMKLMIPEDSAASTHLLVENGYKPVSGDKLMSLGFLCLRVRPSDVDPSYCPPQIFYDYQIKVEVENDTE